MSRGFLIITNEANRAKAQKWVDGSPLGTRLEFRAPRRTIPQNSLLWARLHDISRCVEWYGQRLSAEDWKTVFTASLRKARVVPGIDGGFVVLGLSTSSMTKTEMTELLDLMDAFAAQHDVEFTA